MKLFKSVDKNARRNLLNRILLVSITVVAIVWFLPRNTTKHFNYEINKPWIYGSFIANFDFPILKSESTIKHERDSVLKLFQPYYNIKESVAKEQIEKFKNNNRDIPEAIRQQVSKLLAAIYQNGIMEPSEYKALRKDTANMVKKVSGNNAQSLSITRIYSPKTAYEYLLSAPELAAWHSTVQQLNLNDYLQPNLVIDQLRSESEKNDLLQGISMAKGNILTGQRIIDQGEIVDEQKFQVLASFEREMEKRSDTTERITNTLIGQLLFVTIMVLIFTTYLNMFRRQYLKKQRNILLLYSLLIIFPIMASVIIKNTFFSVYIIPFAMAPFFVRVFMDSRTAFIHHTTMILICSIAVKYQYEFIVLQLVAGLVTIYSLRDLSSRAQILTTSLLVFIAYCAVYLPLHLVQGSAISDLDAKIYFHFMANGILLLLSYPLMFLIEKTFGFTSNVTLIELSNTNKGLLRKLSEVAPGTFQHSIIVGNLAAAIANKIGANSTLVRTGALYHDIGKMKNPAFFTENQKNVNPHSHLTYIESARIIIGHVTEGIRLAEKEGLPEVIKDFILTHHGKGMAKYFYINYQNEHPDEQVDPRPFSYPGPNPQTKEQAILMMADTVEAASRSLKEYTEEAIAEHVNRLIDQQVADGYFKNCPISFQEIAHAKNILIARLKSIYHTRIEYPTLQTGEKKAE